MTQNSTNPSGALLLLDPDSVVLSIVNDRLVISLPGAPSPVRDGAFEYAPETSMFPEGYLQSSARTIDARTLDVVRPVQDELTSKVASPNLSQAKQLKQRRVIASGQARSGGTWEPALDEDSPQTYQHTDRVVVDRRLIDRPQQVRDQRRQSGRRRVARLLIGLLVCAISIGAIVESSLLRVAHIEIDGNSEMSDDSIVASLQLDGDPSMLSVKVAELQAKLTELPLVAKAQVWKSWPNTIGVRVTERFGVATIQSGSAWVILDQTGVVLESRTVRPDLPVVSIDGKAIDLAQLTEQTQLSLQPALVALAAAPSKLIILIERVVVTNGELIFALRRAESAEGARQLKSPAEGPADELIVIFGRPVDLTAKWRSLDTMQSQVDMSKYAVMDVSVADQPALTAKVAIADPPNEVAPADGVAPGNRPTISAESDRDSVEPVR